jgi:hypothetical protein
MDGIPLARQIHLTRDIVAAWEAISNGVVDENNRAREKYWSYWTEYCAAFNQEPYLSGCSCLKQNIIITAFAARVRTGHYGRGHRVKVQTVANALSAISKTLELAGQSSPVYETPGTYRVPVARLMEGYRRVDPPAVPQIAVPSIVPRTCQQAAYQTTNNKRKAVGDLSVIAFYYLLRVGEYTKPRFVTRAGKTKRATRTIQFTIGDVGFFKNNKILSRQSSLKTLLTADSCTLKITNQKNGRMGQTIHHHAIDKPDCPVRALAHRVNHILSNGGTTTNLICDLWTNNKWEQITPSDMLTELRNTVTNLDLKSSGIDPDLVGVHSLRAGGAMALKLTGSNDTTIMKMGRWTSLTFLQYIHNQIAHLSKDLSKHMNKDLSFTNIAAIEQ